MSQAELKISIAASIPSQTELVLLPTFANKPWHQAAAKLIDQKTYDLIISDYKNRPAETKLIYTPKGRVLLFGLGKTQDLSLSSWRQNVQTAILASKTTSAQDLAVVLPTFSSNTLDYIEMTAFAIMFANYNFNDYKQDQNRVAIERVTLVGKQNKASKDAVDRGLKLAKAVNTARSLANHPGNVVTPTHLANHARQLGRQMGFKVKILNKKQIAKEKMGLILGVAAGSEEPPKFIVLEYGPKDKAPIVLVGKGLTFDSGGVSIKPADKMDEMKYDMCGGADVLGIFEAVSALKLKVRLVGLIPSTENLLSGRAVKPGDVLRSHSGKTVEIMNTDAEGRLILADAISYAKKYYQPAMLLDYATLTGAVIMALGSEYTGYLTNDERFVKPLKKAAESCGEKLWQLPLAREYESHLHSSIADLKNIGEKEARAIAAALFLEQFVGDVPWVHFDIAGTAWSTKPKPHLPAGATGWGVLLTVNFLRQFSFATNK